MSRFAFSPTEPLFSFEERATSGHAIHLVNPSFAPARPPTLQAWRTEAALTNGRWGVEYSAEQTAFALAQISSQQTLPSLSPVASVALLLDSRVELRQYFSAALVEQLVQVLSSQSGRHHWNRLDRSVYACVIGAGVAACIDATPQAETLYLRYANPVVETIQQARCESDLPASLRGLSQVLSERFDELLSLARSRLLSALFASAKL